MGALQGRRAGAKATSGGGTLVDLPQLGAGVRTMGAPAECCPIHWQPGRQKRGEAA